MKRLILTAGTLLLIPGLVFLSVWAFNQAFVLENLPGEENAGKILVYRVLQYGILGLVVGILVLVGFFYRKERKKGGGDERGEVPPRARVMGWKAWTVIIVILGVVFSGGIYFLNGDTYFKGEEPVYGVRDKAGNVLFTGTLEEVKNYLARRKALPGPPANPNTF